MLPTTFYGNQKQPLIKGAQEVPPMRFFRRTMIFFGKCRDTSTYTSTSDLELNDCLKMSF